jgi:hypothetical protein
VAITTRRLWHEYPVQDEAELSYIKQAYKAGDFNTLLQGSGWHQGRIPVIRRARKVKWAIRRKRTLGVTNDFCWGAKSAKVGSEPLPTRGQQLINPSY